VNYLVDTSVIIDFLRGKEEARLEMKKMVSQGAIYISVITLGELLYGAYRSTRFAKAQEQIFVFIADFSVTVLPLTAEIVHEYAKVKYGLETKGAKLDDLDLFIGATAVISESTLVTDNVRHFRRFPGIVLF